MGKKRVVAIIGGGNIGTLLLSDLGKHADVSLRLLTSRPEVWSKTIVSFSSEEVPTGSGSLEVVSDDPSEVVAGADILISTLPSHVFHDMIGRIEPYVSPHAWVGFMPGSGGVEFDCADLLRKGCVLFGFQRVHGIARLKEYGQSVYDLGKKEALYIASLPPAKTAEVCGLFERLLSIPCVPLPNFLNVTLTPSNPILHTTRLFSMFQDYAPGVSWDHLIGFYDEWDNGSSECLLRCDAELQRFCGLFDELDLSGVKSLKEHYESATAPLLTDKIRSIAAFKGIKAPMLRGGKGFVPDFSSRYFLEDFPYGLAIIKSFCSIMELATPGIDSVLRWYEKVAGVRYFVGDAFCGEDLSGLPLPQNHGIRSKDDIVEFYGQTH